MSDLWFLKCDVFLLIFPSYFRSKCLSAECWEKAHYEKSIVLICMPENVNILTLQWIHHLGRPRITGWDFFFSWWYLWKESTLSCELLYKFHHFHCVTNLGLRVLCMTEWWFCPFLESVSSRESKPLYLLNSSLGLKMLYLRIFPCLHKRTRFLSPVCDFPVCNFSMLNFFTEWKPLIFYKVVGVGTGERWASLLCVRHGACLLV